MVQVANGTDDSFEVSEKIHDHELEPKESWFYRTFPALKWNKSCPVKLKDIEEKFLSSVKSCQKGWYVDAGQINGQPCRIWTRLYDGTATNDHDDSDKKFPLVMLHGMAAGNAFFCLNYDHLAKDRKVYGLDLPGFARSSRPKFSSDHVQAEEEYVQAIENWRQAVGLEKMCLLGHSFGGFLSSSYTIAHPNRVAHLILADPWGLTEKPPEIERFNNLPWYVKGIFHILKHFNPLAAFRLMGPLSSKAITKARPDLIRKFDDALDTEGFISMEIVPSYIFHCNTANPTGESAFHSIMNSFAWAKRPILHRLHNFDPKVPMTVIYGADSWVTFVTREQLVEVANRENSYTYVELIEDARHHVYADQYKNFNFEVSKACNYADEHQ